ncbi:MAG: AI-2E family transporter [Candidatus Saccharimonadales bacterium]
MSKSSDVAVFKQKIFIVMGIAIGLYLFFLSRSVLAKLGIAILFMVILDPLVKFFMRFMPKKNRFLAIMATFAVLGLFIVVVLARLIPILNEQFSEALKTLNDAANEAQTTGQTLSQALAAGSPTSSINALLPYISKAIPAILDFLFSSINSLLSGLFAQLMVFGFVLFGLIEGPRMVEALKTAVPKERLTDVVWTCRTAYKAVTSYITGNLFISLCAGVASFFFCLIVGIPYPFLMAVAVAICDLVPMFGAYLFGLVLGLFGLLFVGMDVAIIAVIFTVIYQQFENQVLSPIVYNKANSLSPLTVLVAVSIGGAVGGLLGALIAIPVGTTIQLSIQRYLARKNTAPAK